MSVGFKTVRQAVARILLSAIVIGGCVAIVPTASASAAQCVLGPSIGSVAREAGISCPDNISGEGGEPRWGAQGSECKFGWNDSGLPSGFLNYLNGGMSSVSHFQTDDGTRVTRATVVRDGHKVGVVSIYTKSDLTFAMGINLWGRDGNYRELAYFDCKTSSDGAMYYAFSPLTLAPMPAPGTGTAPAGLQGKIETRGSMVAVDGGKYLLRIDLTNTGTTANFIDLQIDLPGYSVDSFPVISNWMECTANQGLACSLEWIAPGQTVTTWILVNSDGTANPAIDVSVTNMGYEKVSASPARGPVNHAMDVSNAYRLTRS